jgi:hypothetical protein
VLIHVFVTAAAKDLKKSVVVPNVVVAVAVVSTVTSTLTCAALNQFRRRPKKFSRKRNMSCELQGQSVDCGCAAGNKINKTLMFKRLRLAQ